MGFEIFERKITSSNNLKFTESNTNGGGSSGDNEEMIKATRTKSSECGSA
uniref:Uncharacterized protein n=1 Tax=Rhizophora mucronata TaxID=61149 RepID=A0A2P2Q7F0_RHIMU